MKILILKYIQIWVYFDIKYVQLPLSPSSPSVAGSVVPFGSAVAESGLPFNCVFSPSIPPEGWGPPIMISEDEGQNKKYNIKEINNDKYFQYFMHHQFTCLIAT